MGCPSEAREHIELPREAVLVPPTGVRTGSIARMPRASPISARSSPAARPESERPIVTLLAAEGARVVFTGRDARAASASRRARAAASCPRTRATPAAVEASVEEAVAPARRPRPRGPERRRAVRGAALGDDRRAVGYRHRRRISSRRSATPARLLPRAARDGRLDGARRLRCRRLGRDADRRVLGLEARADHAHAHARRRGGPAPGCASTRCAPATPSPAW